MEIGDVFINKWNKNMKCVFIGYSDFKNESICLIYHKKFEDFKIMTFFTSDLKEEKVLKNIKNDLKKLLESEE